MASSGILILESKVQVGNGKTSSDTFSLNMKTGLQTKIIQPDENLTNFSVSPDRQWIAYDSYLNGVDNLVIATADGKRYKIIPRDKTWSFHTWLDNQWLLIATSVKETDPAKEPDPAKSGSTFTAYNPFTGEKRILPPDYPDIYDWFPIPDWDGLGETAYNPTLTRVVYLQYTVNGSPAIRYVLWDTVNKKSLASFDVAGDIYSTPRWSPNGEYFAFAPSLLTKDIQTTWPSYEIQIVSSNGQASQATHLTNYYPWVYISDLTWSADGQYIAFWLSTFDKKPDINTTTTLSLAVLDTMSGAVTNYCIPGEHDQQIGVQRIGIQPPIWSPDGKQLIAVNRISQDKSQVVLVDIGKNWAAKITEDMDPVGWMVSP